MYLNVSECICDNYVILLLIGRAIVNVYSEIEVCLDTLLEKKSLRLLLGRKLQH